MFEFGAVAGLHQKSGSKPHLFRFGAVRDRACPQKGSIFFSEAEKAPGGGSQPPFTSKNSNVEPPGVA